jgi:lipopolysaccharide export system protein LptA
MRNQRARRYAQWSAAIAILIAVVVAGVYLHRAYLARRDRALAPPPVPPTVEQQSAGFSYTHSEGVRAIYTIRAASATQYKEGNRNLLEDVWITSYGQQGDRNDTLRTKSCEYISSSPSGSGSSADSGGKMTCAGDVEIDLESDSEAKLHPSATDGEPAAAAQVLHLTTSDLTFEQDSGVASTDHPVTFRFPGGAGKAIGLRFDSQQGQLDLLRDVEFNLRPQGSAQPQARASAAIGTTPANNSMVIQGQSMVYLHADGIAHLRGPAQIQDGASTLTAQDVALDLDQNFHARRALATGQPQLHENDLQRQTTTSADEFIALFTPSGTIGCVIADGDVRVTSATQGEQDEFDAAHIEMEMAPVSGEPHLLTASGGTKGTAHVGAATRTFTTDALQVTFAPPTTHGGSARPELVHTLAPATVQSIAPAKIKGTAQTTIETTRMTGQTLDLHFTAIGQVDHLTGSGGVEVDQDLGAAGTRASTSQNLDAHFDSAGDWTTLDQSGRVHYRDAQGTADADRSHMEHATNTATLTGSVVVTDINSRTTAQSASFAQDTNILHAEGRVISAELATGQNRVGNFSDQQPARVSADHMVADRAADQATYAGHARMWQGQSVVEADTIELDHNAQSLTGVGHVRAVFPAAAWSPSQGSAQPGKTAAPPTTPAAPDLWHAQGGRLTYWSQKSLGRLEQNASADSQEASIRAPTIDFLFGPVDPAKPSGPQQLTGAIATGGVNVRQLDRRGTSQRADYTVVDRKFVLSGGPPVVRDDSGNSTTGRQLTFIFADDRIVVDSEEGTRTLTLHRVEK